MMLLDYLTVAVLLYSCTKDDLLHHLISIILLLISYKSYSNPRYRERILIHYVMIWKRIKIAILGIKIATQRE